ncbi:MAG: cell division/cell wall cluster transcriptional repressor MraZ [Clostridia bacterium]|nr:cell division/cell wall cluster transcriptional repressor MraZ [Clostridia bacterium]
MNFFTGEYNHQLDAKNRIRIPFKLKRDLGENYYFTRGTDNCIFILPEEVAKEQLERISEVKMTDVEKRRGARSFAKSFVAAEEDNQGRVVLPASLREFARIDKDVVFCGVGKRIELWSKEVYDKYFEGDDSQYDEFFNMLDI